MKKLPAAILLLLFLGAAIGAQNPAGMPEIRFYRSNSIGLALEPLSRRQEEEPWLLRVERRGDRELRILYEAGQERRRWESESGSERVLERGVLVEERSFDASGRLLVERSYRDGRLELRSVYRYGSNGLSVAETYDGQDTLLFRDRFSIGPRGELRRVSRELPQGMMDGLALIQTEGRLVEERHLGGGRQLINRFDAYGRLASQEVWQEKELAERLQLAYAGQSSLPESTERSATATDTRTNTQFDAQGRIVKLVVTRGGKTEEEWTYRYDAEGNRLQALHRSAQGAEQWSYFYDGGRLMQDEYRKGGVLEKVTLYEDQEMRVEQLYREGAPFLRVTYRSGRKIREEFLSDGRVLRTREFEEGP